MGEWVGLSQELRRANRKLFFLLYTRKPRLPSQPQDHHERKKPALAQILSPMIGTHGLVKVTLPQFPSPVKEQ